MVKLAFPIDRQPLLLFGSYLHDDLCLLWDVLNRTNRIVAADLTHTVYLQRRWTWIAQHSGYKAKV